MRRLPPTTLRETFVTRAIIVICGLVWLTQITSKTFTEDYALQASLVASEPHRLFTAMWLHSHFPLHIMLNMIALWIFGSQAEPALGWRRYTLLYLAAGIAGNIAIWMSAPSLPAVGASGAIFGIMGFAVVWTRFHWNAVLVTLLNVVFGFLIPNIAWQAHLAGLAVGAALGVYWFMLPELRKRKQLAN